MAAPAAVSARPSTVCFSGGTYPKLLHDVRVFLCASRLLMLPLVAAVAVTVSVSRDALVVVTTKLRDCSVPQPSSRALRSHSLRPLESAQSTWAPVMPSSAATA